jgi:hypothetical protein
MTPKEKAKELVNKYYYHSKCNLLSPFEAKNYALIALEEILETTKVKWATQRKLPNGEYRLWKGVAYKKYWVEVKKEIDAL